EVAKVIAAVELRTEPTFCGFTPLLDPNAPPLCEPPAGPLTIAAQDWEAGLGTWTVGTRNVANPATFDTPDWAVVGSLPDGRAGSAAFVADLLIGNCADDTEAGVLYLQSPSIPLPSGAYVPRVAFNHWVATEMDWDGGNVKINVNGGGWTLVPYDAFDFNPYSGTLNVGTNPLGGEDAFHGANEGELGGSWGQSQISLSGIANPGDTIQLRFEMGLDGCNGMVGWYVDEVQVFDCESVSNVYVDDGATGANDGTSWDDAYTSLQDALGAAGSGDQIWVATGTYKPTAGADRTATFQLITGVEIYGGFDGTEATLEERAGLFDQTILSGDIGTAGDSSDNSYNVVTGSGTDETAVLDGFTITAGNANGSSPYDCGAGMFNDAGSPTVTNCTFVVNSADWGGGMYNFGASPTVTDCTFSGNDAVRYAAGMYNFQGSSPVITNCRFTGNTAGGLGGGMCNYISSSPTVTNCTFTGNYGWNGGGMLNANNSSPTLVNCTFAGNSAYTGAGGINAGGETCSPMVTNCILWGNTPEEIQGGVSMTIAYSNVQGGLPTDIIDGGGNIDLDPLFVGGPSGTWTADGVYDSATGKTTLTDAGAAWAVDELMDKLVNPNTTQTRQFLVAGNTATTVTVWGDAASLGTTGSAYQVYDYHLTGPSPCVDEGNDAALPPDTTDLDGDGNNTEPIPIDLDGNPRILDGDSDGRGVVDMGAYEYPFGDCNENDIPDLCDLDCDALGGDCTVPDCGLSSDDNGDDIPDDCECPELAPPATPAGEDGYEKIRYISMAPGNAGYQTALRVTLTTLPAPFDGLNGTSCWVGEPQQVSENAGKIAHEPGWADFMGANLDAAPHCMDWGTVEVLHVTDENIIPGAVYDVQAIECECDFENEDHYSPPLTITTSGWGDLVRNCTTCPCGAPDGTVGVPTDVTAALDKFKNLRPPSIPCEAVMKARADVEPNFPDWLVNIS
ncbi:MAG: hypothetical protein JSU86_06465, partial [Phycisphaerales bacterium]